MYQNENARSKLISLHSGSSWEVKHSYLSQDLCKNKCHVTAKLDLDNESQLFNLNVGYFMKFNVFSTKCYFVIRISKLHDQILIKSMTNI